MQQQQSNFWDVLNSPPKFTAVLLCFYRLYFLPFFIMNTANTIYNYYYKNLLSLWTVAIAPPGFLGVRLLKCSGLPSLLLFTFVWPRPRTISARIAQTVRSQAPLRLCKKMDKCHSLLEQNWPFWF